MYENVLSPISIGGVEISNRVITVNIRQCSSNCKNADGHWNSHDDGMDRDLRERMCRPVDLQEQAKPRPPDLKKATPQRQPLIHS